MAGPTTWNPSDSANITLSGGNLVATASGASAGARSVVSQASGKCYFELTAGATFVNANSVLGIANVSAILGSMAATPLNAAFVYRGGNVYINNQLMTFLPGMGPGATVCVALDMDALKIWLRVGAAGIWNNSGGDPATGTGYYSTSAFLGVSAPAFAAAGLSASGDSATANFGQSAFVGAVPSGFTAGLLAPGPPPVELAGNLTPQIALGGSLALLFPPMSLSGGLTLNAVLGASEFVSGPLWTAETPAMPSWTPIGPPPPVEWRKSELCNG